MYEDMPDGARGSISLADAGDTVLAMGALVKIIIPASATGGQFALVEHTVPPRGGPPPHTHTVYEAMFILAGTFDVWVGDLEKPSRVGEGASLLVAPGTPHTTRNAGETAARLLSLYAPGGDERFFLEVGTPLTELATVPDMNTQPDLSALDVERVRVLAAKYGMRLIDHSP